MAAKARAAKAAATASAATAAAKASAATAAAKASAVARRTSFERKKRPSGDGEVVMTTHNQEPVTLDESAAAELQSRAELQPPVGPGPTAEIAAEIAVEERPALREGHATLFDAAAAAVAAAAEAAAEATKSAARVAAARAAAARSAAETAAAGKGITRSASFRRSVALRSLPRPPPQGGVGVPRGGGRWERPSVRGDGDGSGVFKRGTVLRSVQVSE